MPPLPPGAGGGGRFVGASSGHPWPPLAVWLVAGASLATAPGRDAPAAHGAAPGPATGLAAAIHGLRSPCGSRAGPPWGSPAPPRFSAPEGPSAPRLLPRGG